MQTGKNHQAPGQVEMDLAGDVGLVGQVADQRWHFEKTEHRDADAIGGRNQVAGNHHREQPQVQ
ncbi:hypothetical protein D9M73_264230 [compost metagenome]